MATEIKSTSIKSQNIIAEPVANKPASPEQGQIIQANGTGNIAKGIYQYSGSAWIALDNAQGDLETLRLIMSTDTDAVGFSSALNSTSTLAGNTNAIPHETSTGTGMLGALDIPSTGGDALLTEFDANKVFRYYSAGANNNNDYFGIPVDIPAQTRGQNIVIKFKYRTEEAGTATTSNGDFQVSVWDKSNGVKTTSTDTSAKDAGDAVAVASSTGMAVGDRIWLESGGNAVNNVGNSITEAYITEVSSSTAIKISADWTPASTAGSLVVSGWLSSKAEGLLPEADSDTNKVGKDYSIAVKTEEDTEQVVVWFSNKSTTTNVIELFFDGILVSQNKFLQASSQPRTECYLTYNQSTFWSTSTATDQFDKSLLSPGPGSPPLAESKLIQITDVSSDTRIIARENIELNISAIASMNAGQMLKIYDSDDEMRIGAQTPDGATAASYVNVTETITLAKNDYIYFKTDTKGSQYGAMTITAKAQTSDVILLENQDEIFTDWVSDGTFTSHVTGTTSNPTFNGANEIDTYQWRRVGSDMEIMVAFFSSTGGTAAGSGQYLISLPSGYSIDTNKFKVGSTYSGTLGFRQADNASDCIWMGGNGYYTIGSPFAVSSTQLGIYGNVVVNDGASTVSSQTGGMWGQTNLTDMDASRTNVVIKGRFSIPIAGWTSNFNPVLSMPLVEIGGTTEQALYYAAVSTNSTSNTYRPYYTNESYNTVSGLGVVDNSSSLGWNFKATQKVKATVNWSWSQTSTGTYSASLIKKNTLGTNVNDGSTDWNGYKIARMNTIAASNPSELTASVLMEPGDYLFPVTNATNSDSASDRSVLSLVVEKDFSNTNMAHIIKPAVAYISDVQAENTTGGACTTGTWSDRTLNTMKGETWFIESLSSNVFTLSAGTYKINVRAPFYRPGDVRIRLYDNTNSSGDIGGSHYGSSTEGGMGYAYYETLKTVTASTAFKIQYLAANNSGTSCLGNATDDTGENEIYTTVQIEKLK